MKKISIIGLGLLGGSLAIDLKNRKFTDHIKGFDKDPVHTSYAKQVGIIDEEASSIEDAILGSDIIIIAVPVSAVIKILPGILDKISDHQIVIDVASTKGTICERVKYHTNRKRYVACHPMAGTENSGPWSAISGMFDGKAVILCDVEDSSEEAVGVIRKMFEDNLNMNPMFFNSYNHDIHVAYVSHMPHVCSFALALTVLEKEKNEKNIFNLASGGFNSTVRIAKSSPDMWTPIFKDNKENVMTVLNTYIEKLQDFKNLMEKDDYEGLYDYIFNANKIKRTLKK
ncbi:MAG: prephenate dehydrogenase [Bacteroidales bacterium]|nr:prephenate dehydrogenase [Bacteroidales bacterium]